MNRETLKHNPNDIESLLTFDAIHAAEKATGKSYKEDKVTESLGMLGFVRTNELKAKVLKETNDMYYGIQLEEAVGVIKSLGFVEYWSENFESESLWEEKPVIETYKIFIHEEYSILLNLDTYGGKKVNSAMIWFNYCGNKGAQFMPSQCSGGAICTGEKRNREVVFFDDDLKPVEYELPKPITKRKNESWFDYSERLETSKREIAYKELCAKYRIMASCSKDVREGLRNTIEICNQQGQFSKKWYEPYSCIALNHYREPYLWLKDGVYSEKLNAVPQHIRENLGI